MLGDGAGMQAMLLIRVAILLVFAADVDHLVAHLRSFSDPTRFLLDMADRYVGRCLLAGVSVLFVTSVCADLLAFHNAASRYPFAVGREGLLPVRRAACLGALRA